MPAAFLWLLWQCSGPPRPPPVAVAQVQAQPTAAQLDACAHSARCVAGVFEQRNISACKPAIERLAAYQARWKTGWSMHMFVYEEWAGAAGGSALVLVGDMLELQNGFGAWQNTIYACTINPTTGQVLEVRAYPGRL